MAGLLRRYAADFVLRYPRQATPHVQSTLAKLSLCRTAALGGRRYHCSSCDHECTVYNSCGDRHCPQCSGAKRADWLSKTAELLLPGVEYFQVVFTIPDSLSALALGNRTEIFNLLFRSAWRSLKQVIQDEQQFEAAAAMVLPGTDAQRWSGIKSSMPTFMCMRWSPAAARLCVQRVAGFAAAAEARNPATPAARGSSMPTRCGRNSAACSCRD